MSLTLLLFSQLIHVGGLLSLEQLLSLPLTYADLISPHRQLRIGDLEVAFVANLVSGLLVLLSDELGIHTASRADGLAASPTVVAIPLARPLGECAFAK